MATLESRLIALAQAIGTDIKALKTADGSLSSLNTTAKTSLVSAINEVFTMVGSAGAAINDSATGAATTYSSNKVSADLTAAISALRLELRSGAGAALDTFAELATALGNDPSFAATIATSLGYRVRFDAAQTLTAPQKAQVKANLEFLTVAETGNLDTDLSAAYVTAKA